MCALTGLSGCGADCRSLDYSLAADAVGEKDPQAAITAWTETSDEGQPQAGWSEVGEDTQSSDRVFESGDWRITVSTLPSGEWVVTSGTNC
ncbi:hypothetical protein Kisp01_66550 [Kineosporia sp. NBRC 101677]|nr:hypothetical protein Kisp01_66550 [Kineosporia sp. NBRC 101677]